MLKKCLISSKVIRNSIYQIATCIFNLIINLHVCLYTGNTFKNNSETPNKQTTIKDNTVLARCSGLLPELLGNMPPWKVNIIIKKTLSIKRISFSCHSSNFENTFLINTPSPTILFTLDDNLVNVVLPGSLKSYHTLLYQINGGS